MNYERALLLDPGDGDIRFNLQLARQKSVDKIEPVGDFFLHRWFGQGSEHGGCRFVGANRYCLFYPFYRLFDSVLLLQVDSFEEDRVLSGAGILGVGHLCQYLCRQPEGRAGKPEERDRVCSDSDSESSPDASGTDLFILHEGTKVSIKSKLGDWNEIEMEDEM